MRALLILLLSVQFSIGQDSLALEKAQILYDQGKSLYYEGEYNLAGLAFDSCLTIRKEILSPPHNLLIKINYRIANNCMRIREYQKAEKYLNIALNQSSSLYGPESDQTSRILNDFGILYSRMRRYSKSIVWNQKSIDVKKKLYGYTSKEVGYTRMNNSQNFYGQGNYVKCINELKEVLLIYDQELKPTDQNYNRVYLTLSNAYRKKGDLDNALIYAEKAVEIKLKNYDETHPSLSKYYDNLAKVQASLNQLDRSKINFEKAAIIYKGHGDKEDLGSQLNDAARVYMKSGAIGTALKMFEKSETMFEDNPRKQAIAMSNIAICKYYLGDSMEAINILEKICSQDSVFDNFLQLAEWKFEINDSEGAIANFDEARKLTPEGDDLSTVKMLVLESKLTKNISIKSSWNSIQEAIEVLTKMRRKYLGSKSKNYINEKLESIFDYAVDLSVFKFRKDPSIVNINDVYRTIEMAKSASFWDDLSEENAAYYGKVPIEVLEEIEILKREGDEKMLELENEMVKLEQDYPLYFSRKYSLEIPILSDVQSKIDEDLCIIDYYVLEDSVFAILITKAAVKLISEKNDGKMTFVKEWNLLQRKPISRISIVPHSFLHFVSFEEIINPTTQKYFIFNYAFSYQVNIESLIHNSISSKKLDYLGIVPTWESEDSSTYAFRNSLVPLPGAAGEVDMASNFFHSTVLSGSDAREDVFYEKAPSFNVIHFATHAKVDPTNELNSYLYFNSDEEVEDGILHTDEIMNIDLNADLVILSACETGSGGIKSGEGVMSLSRAFQYAGAKSVLMSLWRANDHSAQPIILNFVKNYKSGMTKDVALQQSKIKYLKEADPLMRGEIYWAGFMINGDLSAFQASYSWLRSVFIFGIILSLLILLFKFV